MPKRLLGDPRSIPTEKRPNPAVGKDTDIEMETSTPKGEEPFTFATGRIFHTDLGVVSPTLARQRRLFTESPGPHKALVASNPGGGLLRCSRCSRHVRQPENYAIAVSRRPRYSRTDVKKGGRPQVAAVSGYLSLGGALSHSLIDDYEFPK